MTPMGDETKAEMAAVTRDAITQGIKRRRVEDNPKEHATRLMASLALAGVITAAGIGLRVMKLIGEPTLVAFVFLAGVIVKGESIIGLVKAGRKQRQGDT